MVSMFFGVRFGLGMFRVFSNDVSGDVPAGIVVKPAPSF